MIPDGLADRLAQEVDDAFDGQVEALQALVRCPSEMGNEAAAQDLMAELMAGTGLEVDRWALDADTLRPLDGFGEPLVPYTAMDDVVGTVTGAGGGRSLILNGHVDVVPPGPAEQWSAPPFEPVIEDGWMFGRGAGDMKAGLLACVYAWAALRRAGCRLRGDLHVQSVVEEESTGNGTLACIQRGYSADAAVIPEATQATWVRAQVGLLWFDIDVPGDPTHPSKAGTGTSAIEKAWLLYEALQPLEDAWNAARSDHRGFRRLDHPINIVLGQIEGGDWPSSIPAWCRMRLRVGLYPGVPAGEVRRQVDECVAAAAAADDFLAHHPPTVTWKGHHGAGYAVDGADELIAKLTAAHDAAFDQPLYGITSTGSSDARVLGLHGVPAVLYGPTATGYHGYDEKVELDSVRRVTKALALFTAAWCGVVVP